ncbi:MAG: hypothetical protein JSS02_07740 [Planctomycetes bacterium]|nr:hypothetical protein [Planctomycetota bacterium]
MHISRDNRSRNALPLSLLHPVRRSLWVALSAVACLLPAVNFTARAEEAYSRTPTIAVKRSCPVLAPGAELRLPVVLQRQQASKVSEPGMPRVAWSFRTAAESTLVSSGEIPLETQPGSEPLDLTCELQAPSIEGVYTLTLAVQGASLATGECHLPVVVVGAERPQADRAIAGAEQTAAESPAAGQIVDTFDPTAEVRSRRVALDGLTSSATRPVLRYLKHVQGGEAPATNVPADRQAAAYRLQIKNPGRPHVLELIGPTDKPQAGSLSLLEEHEPGFFVALGPECRFTTTVGARSGAAGETSRGGAMLHRQIFWPNDHEPVAVLASRATDQPLSINRVQVRELTRGLLPERSVPRADALAEFPDLRPRLAGPYLHLADLPRNFCGPRASDPSVDSDWQTWWVAQQRLVDYLHYQGHNALLLAVPAEMLWDEGSASLTSADTLELLFRLCDREGLCLIPELSFAGLLTTSHDVTGGADPRQLIDATGQPVSAVDPRTGTLVRLANPLAPEVQQLIQGRVSQFVTRYVKHPAFGGLAIRLGPHSSLQFPGLDAGYNADTVRRFEETSEVRLPKPGEAAGETAVPLSTNARRDWIRFRTREIASFHRRLADVVLHSRPDARVVLTGQFPACETAEPVTGLVSFVRSGTNPARVLSEQGLDFSLPAYTGEPRLTILRPMLQIDGTDSAATAAATSFNLSPTIDTAYRATAGGALVHTLPSPGHNATALRPAPAGETEAVSATASRISPRPWLGNFDAQMVFEGGGLLPLQPHAADLRCTALVTHLPGMPFRSIGPSTQPLVVRTAQSDVTTWMYVVNMSALHVTAELSFDCPAATSVVTIPEGQALSLATGKNGKSLLTVELGGFGVWAVRFDRQGVNLESTQVTIEANSLETMKQRIERLNGAMRVAAVASGKVVGHTARRPVSPGGARQVSWDDANRQPDSLDNDEIRQLTKTVSSVKLSWDEGRYTDCQRLLDGYWGQLLLSMPIDTPTAPPSAPPPKFSGRPRDKLPR